MALLLIIALLLTTSADSPVHADLTEAQVHPVVEAMVAHGFENIRILDADNALAIEYENRVYFRERDALEVIAAAVVDMVTKEQRLILIPKRDDVPLFQLAMSRDAVMAYAGSQINSPEMSWEVRSIDQTLMGQKYNSSAGKLDITLYPELSSLLGRTNDPFIYRFAISPRFSSFLGHGIAAHSQVRFLIHDELRREKRRISLARMYMDYTFRSANVTYANVNCGYYDYSRYGLSAEALRLLWGDRIGIGGDVAWLGTMYYSDGTLYFTRLWRWTALANLHYIISRWDLMFSARFGRFLYEDDGASIELTRFFHNTSITAFATKTNQDSIIGIELQLLTYPRRHLKPERVRVKLPTTLKARYINDESNAGEVFSPGRDIDYVTERFWLMGLD